MKRPLALLALSVLSAACTSSSASDEVVEANQSATTAPTPVRHELTSVREISYISGNEYTFGYQTSGGCAQHWGEAEMLLEIAEHPLGGPENIGSLSIFDASDAPDFCEGVLYPQLTVDLRPVLEAQAAHQGITLDSFLPVPLTLPRLGLTVAHQPGPATTPAPAPSPTAESSSVRVMSHLTADPLGNVAFSYTVGGGCAVHTAAPSLEVTREPQTWGVSYTARLVMVDVSSFRDGCESIVQVDGTVNLSDLLLEAAAKHGDDLRGQYVEVELPPVEVGGFF